MNTTARTVNTRPQLIARFAAGEATDGICGAILVYLFETAGAPFFRICVDRGSLPENVRSTYATAKAAIQTAADLCLTLIYDEVVEIEEVGDEDEAAELARAAAAGMLDSAGLLECAQHDVECRDDTATAEKAESEQLDAVARHEIAQAREDLDGDGYPYPKGYALPQA